MPLIVQHVHKWQNEWIGFIDVVQSKNGAIDLKAMQNKYHQSSCSIEGMG